MLRRNFVKILLLIILSVLTYISYELKISLANNVAKAQENLVTLQEEDVHQFAQNIEKELQTKCNNKIEKTLKNDSILRTLMEDELHLLVTNKYRYVFVLNQEKDGSYRFLLDGSPEKEKSEYNAPFVPEDSKIWKKQLVKQKAFVVDQKEINTLWKSYIYPIKGSRIIVVIDFAAKEAKNLLNIMTPMLKVVENVNNFLLLLLAITYIFVVASLFLQRKVEATKEELHLLNASLEHKIKVAVEENQRKDKMLQEQSRLALMGEMISMIAHQWRQPLGAISASTFGLQLKVSSPKMDFSKEEDRKQFLQFLDTTLDKISEDVQFLSTTIDDFRTFFQSDKKRQKVILEIPLKRALHIVEASLKSKGIELTMHVSNYDEIEIYPNEIMQVILNLIKNSEDVLVQNKVENPKIEVNIYKKSKHIILEVKDNGGGISEDIREKIFDPYFSTKSEKNGTGLGLYMSKLMIEEHHNATLRVKNIDDGVCFTMTFQAK